MFSQMSALMIELMYSSIKIDDEKNMYKYLLHKEKSGRKVYEVPLEAVAAVSSSRAHAG